MWKLARNALPIAANLKAQGLNINSTCLHCWNTETAANLFLECPFARQVWKFTPTRIPMFASTPTSISQPLAQAPTILCLPPTGISAYIFSWACWSLWNARNLLVFKSRNVTACSVMIEPSKKPDNSWWLSHLLHLCSNLLVKTHYFFPTFGYFYWQHRCCLVVFLFVFRRGWVFSHFN